MPTDTSQDRAQSVILGHWIEGPWHQHGQMKGWAGSCICGQDFWEDTAYAVREAWAEHLAEALASPPSSDALREALEWYGEQARLARLIHSEGDAGRQALAEDGGKRARAALQPSTGRGCWAALKHTRLACW